MLVYRCDGCGEKLAPQALRYVATIEVRAAYDTLEVGLTELVRDHRSEIAALIEQMGEEDAAALEEQIFKRITLDLCPRCQRAFIRSPLRFQGRPVSPEEPPVDIDSFLRSLGFGGSEQDTSSS